MSQSRSKAFQRTKELAQKLRKVDAMSRHNMSGPALQAVLEELGIAPEPEEQPEKVEAKAETPAEAKGTSPDVSKLTPENIQKVLASLKQQ